ncbi:MAG: sulfur carrier protein ThiS [Oscillospiraceae bacterium]|nr:sulfur carrier protein ThiS [Oscillospiraceae bacterium]
MTDMVMVNGTSIVIDKGMSVTALLMRESYDLQRVAVEKNGHIVPRSAFDSDVLINGDKLEVVHFVGGG